MTTVDNPVEKVYLRWKSYLEENYDGDDELGISMDMSRTPSKFPYIRMMYMGGVFSDGDITGNECATTISFQIESFTGSVKNLTEVYSLDSLSHEIMVEMGFRRTYHGNVENVDSSIARLVSRYRRIYTGQL